MSESAKTFQTIPLAKYPRHLGFRRRSTYNSARFRCGRASRGLGIARHGRSIMSVAALPLSVIGATFCVLAAADVASAQRFSSEQHEIRVVTVVRGLVHPWSLAFLPNGDMLVTDRVGRLRIIRNGELSSSPVPGVPEVAPPIEHRRGDDATIVSIAAL